MNHCEYNFSITSSAHLNHSPSILHLSKLFPHPTPAPSAENLVDFGSRDNEQMFVLGGMASALGAL
jgi:hypothetical protein